MAWGELPAEGANRGEGYTLAMQRGPKREIEEVKVEMVAGAAYVLTAQAQGRTAWGEKRCVAHESCGCCWTHGIWNEASCHLTWHVLVVRPSSRSHTRQSVIRPRLQPSDPYGPPLLHVRSTRASR